MNWVQFVDDHAFEVSFSETGHVCAKLALSYQGIDYTLKQLHFHSPSEHTIAGGYYDAELHMVHKNADGTKALVLGVFMTASSSLAGASNLFLNNLWTAAATSNGNSGTPAAVDISFEWEIDSTTALNPYTEFLPASKAYFTYDGSLTTFPCSEGIKWIVFEQPMTISQNDLSLLRGAVAAYQGTGGSVISTAGNDNRPVQPLNGRTVLKYRGQDASSKDDYYTVTVLSGVAIAFAGLLFIAAIIALIYCCVRKPATNDYKPSATA